MTQLRQIAPLLLLTPLLIACGGSQTIISVPPPAPDFALAFSPATLSVTDGATSSPVNVSITAKNGFSGSVQITLDTPAGIISNPSSPFSVNAGANASVIFGASANATTGTFTLTGQALSGSLSHSATLALTVNASTRPALPRTTYARSDSVPALDDPVAEPHLRR